MLRLGSSDSIEQAFLDLKPATYLYFDRNSGYMFMDSRELRAALDPGRADRRQKGLPDRELRGHADLSRGQPVGVQLPPTVTLRVTEADPSTRGNTVNAVTKKVKLETGLEVRVPGYIETGELVKVSTETGEFQGRVKE